jgi:restriction system protein
MWLSLNKKIYRRFHNIILPARNGTAQIDHLLVSRYGLFIVETKNIKGWIFGSKSQPKWTQVLYKRKYSFQNPIRQTFRQKKVLCEFLGLDESTVHTVVYFVGDCKFKTPLPANVLKSGLGRYIKGFQYQILSYEDVDHVTWILEQYMSGTTVKRRDHVRSLRKRHASTTVCPKCGSNLVERIAKKGPNAGSKFLGCESYPKCRFTKNI